MSKIVDLVVDTLTRTKSKEKEWETLGKKYKANQLSVLNKGESYITGNIVSARYGYALRWKVDEDDIHVYGDNAGNKRETQLHLDSTLFLPRSINKLKLAIKCWEEIEKDKKKYY